MSRKLAQDLPEAKDIKACVGMWRWRAFAFVSQDSCPMGRAYCFEMTLDADSTRQACPHFCEVETVDWMAAVKCDHPDAEADYG